MSGNKEYNGIKIAGKVIGSLAMFTAGVITASVIRRTAVITRELFFTKRAEQLLGELESMGKVEFPKHYLSYEWEGMNDYQRNRLLCLTASMDTGNGDLFIDGDLFPDYDKIYGVMYALGIEESQYCRDRHNGVDFWVMRVSEYQVGKRNRRREKVMETIMNLGIDEDTQKSEAIKKIMRYAQNSCSYDRELAHRSINNFYDGSCTCVGYTFAVAELMRACGINCKCMVGTADDIGHIWNYIDFGGKRYWLDATNLSTTNSDRYLISEGLWNDYLADSAYIPPIEECEQS